MAKAKKATKVKHGTGVVQFIYGELRKNKTNEEILKVLTAKFPESRAGIAGIGWCRNKLRKDGEKIKTNLELKAARVKGKSKKSDDLAA